MVQKWHLKPTVFFFKILFIIPSVNMWVAFKFKKIGLAGCTWYQDQAETGVLKGSEKHVIKCSFPFWMALLTSCKYVMQNNLKTDSATLPWVHTIFIESFTKKKLLEYKKKSSIFKCSLILVRAHSSGDSGKAGRHSELSFHVSFGCMCVHVQRWISHTHSSYTNLHMKTWDSSQFSCLAPVLDTVHLSII